MYEEVMDPKFCRCVWFLSTKNSNRLVALPINILQQSIHLQSLEKSPLKKEQAPLDAQIFQV